VGRRGLTILVLALLLGSAAAFTRTEKLKLEPAPVAKPRFERRFAPACGCPKATAHLSFLLRRPERLDVSIVDSDGAHVVTLAQGRDLRAGRVRFKWNGRDGEGRVVSEGVYRLRVRLEHDRRTILIPIAVQVDTVAPLARLLGLHANQGIDLRYRSNEAGRAILFLDGHVLARGKRRPPGTWRMQWEGSLPARPGRGHEVTLVVVDRAGNRSEPTKPVVVTSS
jgi:hypothetical protein